MKEINEACSRGCVCACKLELKHEFTYSWHSTGLWITDRLKKFRSFSINHLNFYSGTFTEQLGNSWFPYPPFPLLKVTLHPPGETAHVIKSLPCQLIHGFINIQMCYQTGTGSSGRVGGAPSLLAVVYYSINYPAVLPPCASKQCHTSSSPSKSSRTCMCHY